jgi:mannose-6-phosphate isomerase-like protein (cupin superfamily)
MNLTILATICIVTMFYIHVVFHLKTSDDLEVFEIQMPPKHKLEDVCNFRQPILFNHTDELLQQCTPQSLQEYNAFDVNVYDQEYAGIPVTLEQASVLFKNKVYATYHNSAFLNETMAKRYYIELDSFLRPPMVSSISYDVLFGSPKYTTRLSYHNHYRTYYYVTSGTVTVKLTPPRNTKYLQEVKNYEEQEFYSDCNPWKDPTKKVKYMEVVLKQGQILFIPAYWWYSIQLEEDSCVCSIQYKTVMNIIATMPDIAMGILQRQNTKHKVLPTYSPEQASSPSESRT